MTIVLKLIVAAPVLLAVFFLYLFYRSDIRSTADFQVEQITYSKAYLYSYGYSRRYWALRIESEKKAYKIYPNDDFLPQGMTLDKIESALSKTTKATVWTEKQDETNSVRGIEVAQLSIPPSRGLQFVEKERRLAAWTAAVLFVAGVALYFYFKKYFKLDWKLDFGDFDRPKLKRRLFGA